MVNDGLTRNKNGAARRAQEDVMADMTGNLTGKRSPRGGMYYEDFEVGRLYPHTLRRTGTHMDNMLFSNRTLGPQPLHTARDLCEEETDGGQPLMNSLFTRGPMVGIQVSDMTVGT